MVGNGVELMMGKTPAVVEKTSMVEKNSVEKTPAVEKTPLEKTPAGGGENSYGEDGDGEDEARAPAACTAADASGQR